MATKRGISISFKNITKDMELYSMLVNMEDKSNVLKQILYKVFVLEYDLVPKKENRVEIKNEVKRVSKIQNSVPESDIEDSEVDVFDF